VWLEEGRVRAAGAAAEIADRYLEDVDLRAVADGQAAAALPGSTARAGTGEIRITSIEILDSEGRALNRVREGGTLVVRAGYQAISPIPAPVFQIGIVDVETGITVAVATSSPSAGPPVLDGSGAVECVFASLPLRPRQYALRTTVADSHQLVSYDVLAAGPRFAVVAAGGGPLSADAADGIVNVAYRFEHRVRVLS